MGKGRNSTYYFISLHLPDCILIKTMMWTLADKPV